MNSSDTTAENDARAAAAHKKWALAIEGVIVVGTVVTGLILLQRMRAHHSA